SDRGAWGVGENKRKPAAEPPHALLVLVASQRRFRAYWITGQQHRARAGASQSESLLEPPVPHLRRRGRSGWPSEGGTGSKRDQHVRHRTTRPGRDSLVKPSVGVGVHGENTFPTTFGERIR